MGGIVELLYELSVYLHESATFLCKHAELFCHEAYTVTFRVEVSCGCAIWVMPGTVEAVGHHFLLACPSSSPVMNTANTMMTRERKSVIIDLPKCALLLG